MKKAIAALFAAAALVGLAGCDSNAQSNMSTGRVWRLTPDGVAAFNVAGYRTASVRLPGWLWAGDPHCPPEMTVGPTGEVVVTSNVVPVLWRIDPATLAVTVHEPQLAAASERDIGFAAIVYSPQEKAFVAYSEVQREVWKIDPELKSGAKIGPADFRTLPCTELGAQLGRFAGLNG